jgi:type IV pilus assembly protein PilV
LRINVATGFTIVEVLVAIIVLALGLIGGTAMQLAALRTRHQSALLSNAVRLASGMADKMRANAPQLRRDDDDNPYLNLDYDAVSAAAPAPAQQCFAGAPCTSEQLASFDIYELKQQLKAELPGGRVVICRDENAWDPVAKSLGWVCSGAAGAPIVIKLGWRGKNPDGSAPSAASRPSVAITLTAGAR